MANKKEKCCDKKTSIGGQALIEGIMMRGPHKTVMAVRLPNGEITVEPVQFNSLAKRIKPLGWPVIRGAVSLVESMLHGYKALMRSADLSGMLDEEEEKTEEVAEEITEEAVEQEAVEEPIEEKTEEKKSSSVLTTIVGVISGLLGVLLAVVLFMYLPSITFDLVNRLANNAITPYRALFEGVIKILIFVGYMFAVSFMKEIKRVFMFHGAEHKCIFCYEKGLELTVENVKMQRRFHPRCGTSFLILMLIVSILVNFLLLTFVPGVSWLAANMRVVWVVIKLLMLPLMCGLGYELIRFCGKHENWLTKAISAPGVWLQHISTKEPDDGMIEVAIEALRAVIPENEEDDRW